ncbi:hypothetical protein OG455_18235 [Kitasatospora sp. NBC_01287]|uniref:hypothetical protein n=1 Tax=Kitasatospora sp. NBC_01287 TaxID=2903573 RepID=UPI002259FCE6|nr:hypothetical protein [Kitasatospora sp. NBC_01287]MCX4747436.1 hypothetical protein [Kitasatospora sp. NBC_01287]
MADSYAVDPEALKATAKGINDAIAELRTLGIDESAEGGRGFSEIGLTGLQVGNPGLQSALADFCERWSWGVRTLVHDGNEIAQRLGLSAGMYYDQEQYASGMLKDVVSAAIGDPDLTQEQVEGQSWGRTWSDNPYTDLTRPDDSAASLDKAVADSRAAWAAEGKDLENSAPLPGLPGVVVSTSELPGGKG